MQAITVYLIGSYFLLNFPNSYETEQLFPIPVSYKIIRTAVHKKKKIIIQIDGEWVPVGNVTHD